jgi:pilus assembly protein CpaB
MQIQQIQKRFLLVIAAVAGIAAAMMVKVYLQKREVEMWERLKQQVQQTVKATQQPASPPPLKMGIVLVAKNNLPAQTPITSADIAIKELPENYIQPGAVTSLDQVIGQITSVPVGAGEQILKIKLLPPGNFAKSLSEITPSGKRAVSVQIANISDIISLIQPGNYVDAFALITPPTKADSANKSVYIGQRIEVLAVGNELVPTASSKKSPAVGAVTLALTPQEAILFSFVQEHGKIKLVLRSPEDTKIEPIQPADWDTLLEYIYPATGTTMAGKPQSVEIYRGLKKETVSYSETPFSEEKK